MKAGQFEVVGFDDGLHFAGADAARGDIGEKDEDEYEGEPKKRVADTEAMAVEE